MSPVCSLDDFELPPFYQIQQNSAWKDTQIHIFNANAKMCATKKYL